MPRYFLSITAAIALAFAVASPAKAQTAVLNFDDHNGSPNSGTYMPGDSFTFSITLHFVPSPSVPNVAGISYWFQQLGVTSAGPFYFSITGRDITGSQFSFPQSSGNIFPQPMNSTTSPFGSNVKDLGASTASGSGLPGGDYFVANVTLSIDPTTPAGVYQIANTTTGGKTSVIFSDTGSGANVSQSVYTVTVVPEPSTLAFCASGFAVTLGFLRFRARRS